MIDRALGIAGLAMTILACIPSLNRNWRFAAAVIGLPLLFLAAFLFFVPEKKEPPPAPSVVHKDSPDFSGSHFDANGNEGIATQGQKGNNEIRR